MESYSQLEAMIQNPLAYKKRWIHVPSSNPRENHIAMDGQEVFKREAFVLNGKRRHIILNVREIYACQRPKVLTATVLWRSLKMIMSLE